jgi:hypothetical protein
MTADQIRDALLDLPCSHEMLLAIIGAAEKMAHTMDMTGQWDRMDKVHEHLIDAFIQLEDTYAAEQME